MYVHCMHQITSIKDVRRSFREEKGEGNKAQHRGQMGLHCRLIRAKLIAYKAIMHIYKLIMQEYARKAAIKGCKQPCPCTPRLTFRGKIFFSAFWLLPETLFPQRTSILSPLVSYLQLKRSNLQLIKGLFLLRSMMLWLENWRRGFIRSFNFLKFLSFLLWNYRHTCI